MLERLVIASLVWSKWHQRFAAREAGNGVRLDASNCEIQLSV
jgi:hypothetical protein